MGRHDHGLALLLLLLMPACAPDVLDIEVPDISLQPLRGQWSLEVDASFDVQAVSRISIGGLEEANNFANRGDVIVRFDGAPGRITVELRPFTYNRAVDIEEDLERLTVWTHRLGDGLGSPADLLASACEEHWDRDCGIRVHFDGQTQVRTAGADLRVTLPPEFAGHVDVVTDDNDEFDYINTGDVCMLGLHGTANVELESGRAWLSLADDIALVPGCPEPDVLACESADPAWSFDCPCLQPAGFPTSRVRGEAADMVVSVPSAFWANLAARAEPPCEATMEVAPENAPPGTWPDAGYRVEATSTACDEIEFYEAPEDWHDSAEPETEQRGNVEICRDCLRDVTCAELLP